VQSAAQQSQELASAAEELQAQIKSVIDDVEKFKLSRKELSAGLSQADIPAGITPEMLRQIASMLKPKDAAGLSTGVSVNNQAKSKGGNGKTAPFSEQAGQIDPKNALPLDEDERGYGDF